MINEGKVYKISSQDGKSISVEELSELHSDQEETDYRQVLYLFYAKKNNFKYAVVRTSDSDPLFILLYFASKLQPLVIHLDSGTGVHRRQINVTELANDLREAFCKTNTSLLGKIPAVLLGEKGKSFH